LDSIADLIYSQPSRKVMHDDGQSPVDAEYVISKLTVQDDVVFVMLSDYLVGIYLRRKVVSRVDCFCYFKDKL
jgi:hypothetical protein